MAPLMLYAIELNLTTAMLGDTRDQGTGVRRFARDANNAIRLGPDVWKNALTMAQADICSHYNLEGVLPANWIRTPSTQLYKRRYNQTKTDYFEIVQKGAHLKTEFLVRGHNFPQSPGQDGLTKLLNHIGEWIGISPWGVKYNYGRFTVVHVTPIRDETKKTSDTQHTGISKKQ